MAADPLPRFARRRGQWLSTVIASIVMAGFVGTAAGSGIRGAEATAVFMAGPIVMLAGLHARLWGYLHAPRRQGLLPLPLAPSRHFADAARTHRAGLAVPCVAGSVALAIVALTQSREPALLLASWGWFVLLTATLEPAIVGYAAHLGRRFDEGTPERSWQRGLGGGWTTPEAVVHLYAPALGLGAAAALAMPGQLTLERLFSGAAPRPAHWALTLGPLVVAGWFRARAATLYAAGFFEAVPWLSEATRTLDGPPTPRRGGALRRVSDPLIRLRLLQAWRLTPAPSLRLAVCLLVPASILAGVVPVHPVSLGLVLAFAAVWVVPLGAVAEARHHDALALAALPLRARHRRERLAWVVLASPAMIAVTLGAIAWTLGTVDGGAG